MHSNFCLVFTASPKWRVELRAKIGHYRNRCFLHFLRFCLLRKNNPHAKIKPIYLYEGNRISIVKITPTWHALRTFSRNFPPAKITPSENYHVYSNFMQLYTVDGLNFVGYQFSCFFAEGPSMKSRTHEMLIFCMNYKRKYYSQEFWTPWMCHFCSIHEKLVPRKIKPSTVFKGFLFWSTKVLTFVKSSDI